MLFHAGGVAGTHVATHAGGIVGVDHKVLCVSSGCILILLAHALVALAREDTDGADEDLVNGTGSVQPTHKLNALNPVHPISTRYCKTLGELSE